MFENFDIKNAHLLTPSESALFQIRFERAIFEDQILRIGEDCPQSQCLLAQNWYRHGGLGPGRAPQVLATYLTSHSPPHLHI